MRKIAVALLATPVFAIVYLELALRRSVAARAGLVLGVGALLGLAGLGGLGAGSTTAVRPTDAPAALAATAFGTTLRTGQALHQGVSLTFAEPVDTVATAAAIAVDPPTAVDVSWDAGATHATIVPRAGWAPGTYYVVTVRGSGDAAATAPRARAAFLTRPALAVRYAANPATDGRMAADGTFSVIVDGDVDPAALAAAVNLEPAADGHVAVTREVDDSGATSVIRYRAVFVPSGPLEADTTYTLTVDPTMTDADGVAARPARRTRRPYCEVASGRPVPAVRRSDRHLDLAGRLGPVHRGDGSGDDPAGLRRHRRRQAGRRHVPLVRGRHGPGAGSDRRLRPRCQGRRCGHDRGALGRRCPDGGTARDRLHDRRPSCGTRRRREDDSTADDRDHGFRLRFGQRLRLGWRVRLGRRKRRRTGSSTSTWADAERYVVSLMNCTRGGGWVETDGSCSSPGGSSLGALSYDSGIAAKVSRPYAKKLATSGVCSHISGSGPDDRLRAAGYTSYKWGENLTCRYYSSVRSAAIGAVRFFQSEKSANGGHWRNMMDPKYDRAGVGLWVSGGRLRIVIDFYHP